LVSFRLGPQDAELLEKYFAPEFSKEDLINLPNFNFYIKLMIDGVLSKSFSSMNIPPASLPERPFIQEIIQYSREHYASLRQEVEKKVAHWELLDFSPSFKDSGLRDKKIGIKEGWEAVCTNCGKKIIVPFQPDPARPVYCDECFKEIRMQRGENSRQTSSSQYHGSKAEPKKGEIKEIIKNIFRQDT